MNHNFKISIIVATYNASNRIYSFVNTLQNQTIKNFEIVFVNDGSSDDTHNVLNVIQSKFELCKIVNQQNAGRAAARNAGVANASGDLIIFFDDDMYLEPNCIELHINFHTQNPNQILIGNGYRNPRFAKSNFAKYLIDIEKMWKSNDFKEYYVTLKKPRMTACNLSVPKLVFEKLHGFDIQLRDNEDVDLCIKALMKNYQIYYNENILAWHNDQINFNSFVKRQIEYSNAFKRFLQLKPNYAILFPEYLQTKKKNIFKITILKFFKIKYLLQIDSLFNVIPLPNFISKKIYNLILAANING